MPGPCAAVRLDGGTFATILAMSAVTYLCRGGGYWLFRQIRPPPFVRTMLGYVPGALFVSYVAPALVGGGPQQWAGAVATLAAMRVTGNLAIAIVVGTASAWAVWSLR